MPDATTPGGETPQGTVTTTPTTPPPAQTPATPPAHTQTPPAATPSPTTPGTPSAPTGQDPDGEGEGPFDAERAMSLIRKLRAEAKQATTQLKELDQLRAEKKAADDAKLSEQERQANRIKQLEAEVAHERTERQERTNRYEVQLHAAKLGIVDPEAAVKLLDWGALEYDTEGRPKDVDTALKQLLKDRPYLSGQAPGTAQVAGQQVTTSATNGATRTAAPGQRTYTAAEISDRAFYLAHRDDIQKAFREGRITN